MTFEIIHTWPNGSSSRPPRSAAGGRAAALATALGAVALAGCDNECDFFERCSGDVLEICGEGRDQSFGRRVRREPCTAPNTTCVQRDDEHAACVLPDRPRCDGRVDPRCEGDVLVSCQGALGYADPSAEPPRYLVGADCGADGGSCVDDGDRAQCVADAEP